MTERGSSDLEQYTIDALRRSEARLAGIIASAMDAIISVNDAQAIIVFNAAAEAMFQCPAGDAIGTSLSRFIPERFRHTHAGHIRAFGQTGVTSRSMWTPGTLVGLRSDGDEFPIEATISQTDSGNQKVYTVILRDITERKRAEMALLAAEAAREQLLHATKKQALVLQEQAERLEAANEELARFAEEAKAANQAKSDFLAVMSHELRTPLNAIAGYTELLELGIRGPVTSEQLADLRRIRKSQQHLLVLINEVLNFTKLETTGIEYRLGVFPVHEFLAGIEELVQPQLRAKALRYVYVSADPQLTAYGDRDKVQQVLLNLMSNAIKFTPAAGRITLSCETEGNAVLIRVRDTGCGIPADQIEAIFEPFVQVDRRLTRQSDGVGLGLAISRDLACGMGGRLQVESRVGEGSTFTLSLARTDPVGEEDIPAGSRPDAGMMPRRQTARGTGRLHDR